MSSDERRDWSGWMRDVSKEVVGAIVTTALLALVALLMPPVRDWLSSLVYLYGWALVALLLVVFITGCVVGWWRVGSQRSSPVEKLRPHESLPVAGLQPSELEKRAIRLMRIADGKWASFDLMLDKLAASSRQDLAQSLRRLLNEQWIQGHEDNTYRDEGAKSYRLADRGITFARENGYETMTEITRQQAARALSEGGNE